MKISILSHDVSHNCVGRALVLADLLKDKYEVEIIGPSETGEIWKPLKNNPLIKSFPEKGFSLRQYLKAIDGDIIYAIKPRTTSYGYALIKKILTGKKVILDIDDWELGFFLEDGYKFVPHHLTQYKSKNNFLSTFILENIRFLSDEISVCSEKLKDKFGGHVFTHVRDANIFNSEKYDKVLSRRRLGLKNEKVILFLGTPKLHKGIDEIIKALDILNDPTIKFVIVGDTKFKLPTRKYIIRHPEILFEKIPEIINIADLIVLPQKKSSASWGQVPAKLIDAMAMSKPIISSNVSDIPNILKDCGIIIEPGDVGALVKAIDYVFSHEKEAKSMANKAREKFVRLYSTQVNRAKMSKIIQHLQTNSSKTPKIMP